MKKNVFEKVYKQLIYESFRNPFNWDFEHPEKYIDHSNDSLYKDEAYYEDNEIDPEDVPYDLNLTDMFLYVVSKFIEKYGPFDVKSNEELFKMFVNFPGCFVYTSRCFDYSYILDILLKMNNEKLQTGKVTKNFEMDPRFDQYIGAFDYDDLVYIDAKDFAKSEGRYCVDTYKYEFDAQVSTNGFSHVGDSYVDSDKVWTYFNEYTKNRYNSDLFDWDAVEDVIDKAINETDYSDEDYD